MTDERLNYHFNSRADLIALGEKLGQAVKSVDHPRPWHIRLDGDFSSGKSLVALAIDKGVRPASYPDGLHGGVRIQTLMPEYHSNLHTVFRHFAHIIRESRKDFDGELDAFEAKYPAARILIASNLNRSIMGNDLEDGLDSDRLDMAVRVHKAPGAFERHVELIVKDPAIMAAICG